MKVIVSKIIDNSTFKASSVVTKKHSLYKKYVRVLKSYLVDSAGLNIKVGDSVEIVNTRPISKSKKWIIKQN